MKLEANRKKVIRIFQSTGLLGIVSIISPQAVLALAKDTVKHEAYSTVSTVDGENEDLIGVVVDILNYAIGLVGLIAIAFLIYGGILFITAGGDETKVEKATKTITQALIGLVIVILSGIIVNFVINQVVTKVTT